MEYKNKAEVRVVTSCERSHLLRGEGYSIIQKFVL